MSTELAVAESNDQDSYLTRLQADIAMLSSHIEVFNQESVKLKREIMQDDRHKKLTKIKKMSKQLRIAKSSLVSEYNGVQKFVLEGYMPGESLFNKTMALVEANLGTEKPLQISDGKKVKKIREAV